MNIYSPGTLVSFCPEARPKCLNVIFMPKPKADAKTFGYVVIVTVDLRLETKDVYLGVALTVTSHCANGNKKRQEVAPVPPA